MSRRPTPKRASTGHYPDARNHCPSPAYMAALVQLAGDNVLATARNVGANETTVRRWLAPGTEAIAYLAQYALEALAIEQLVLSGHKPAAALKTLDKLRAEHLAQLQPKD